MKTLSVISLVILMVFTIALGGGIVTNTNQSAEFIRTLNRNASTSVDAAYFNPAGLTKLEDGIYLSFSNQSIFQTKEVINNYKGLLTGNIPYGLNEDTFEGEVKAPIFPDFYLAYKKGSLALSAAVMPIGGGGSANFAKGLPSFEIDVSDLVPGLAAQGVTEYKMDAAFEGSSIYLGGQMGVAYKVNDKISVAVGGRYVSASNTYKGHLRDIQINPGGTWMTAQTFFLGAASQYSAAATSATTAADNLTAAINAGLIHADSLLTDPTAIAGLQAFGIDPTGFTNSIAVGAFTQAATQASASATAMEAKATATADKEVDAAQNGTGFAPIISINISPMEGLNIGFRYEGITKLELENDTKKDDTGLYPDKAKTNADMPAMVALGVSYQVMPQLKTEVSYNYYMNTGVDWDGREDDVENGFEAGLALEYALNSKLLVSGGFLHSKGGALENYQTDVSYNLNSNTVGFGIAYSMMPNLAINLGVFNTIYDEAQKSFSHYLGGDPTIALPVTEKYNKTSMGFAIGVQYKL